MSTTAHAFFQAIMLIGFCAMIIDGRIDYREVTLNQSIFKKSPMGQETSYQEMTNHYIKVANADAPALMEGYFHALASQPLTKHEKISLMIVADSLMKIDGALIGKELQFLKLTQSKLELKNEDIHQLPELDTVLEKSKGETEIADFIQSLDLAEFYFLK